MHLLSLQSSSPSSPLGWKAMDIMEYSNLSTLTQRFLDMSQTLTWASKEKTGGIIK